jgi:hypothetical protein
MAEQSKMEYSWGRISESQVQIPLPYIESPFSKIRQSRPRKKSRTWLMYLKILPHQDFSN